MRVTGRSASMLASAVGVLLLAACSGGGGEPTPAPDDDVIEETTEPSEPPEEDDDAAGSGGAACLEGDWEADVDVIRENAISVPGLAEFSVDAVVTGTSLTTFDGSTMTTVYSDQQTDMSWAIEGQQFRTVTRYDGTIIGAYTATDGELTIASVDTSGLTFESTTSVNGEPFELPGIEETIESGFGLGGTSTYTCTDDELRIQPMAEGVDTSTFVSLLHRR